MKMLMILTKKVTSEYFQTHKNKSVFNLQIISK